MMTTARSIGSSKYVLFAYTDLERTDVRHVIEFDALTGISENYINDVAAHSVDTGALIHDHVVKKKDKVSIQGVITDLSFNRGEEGLIRINESGQFVFDKNQSSFLSKKAKDALLEINRESYFCSVKELFVEGTNVVVIRDVFPLIIESLNLDSMDKTYGAIQPKITFVEVNIVSPEFAELSGDQKALGAIKNQNNAQTSAAQQAKAASDEEASKSDPIVPLDLEKSDIDVVGEEAGMMKKLIDKSSSIVSGGIDYFRNKSEEFIQKEADVDKRLAEIRGGN